MRFLSGTWASRAIKGDPCDPQGSVGWKEGSICWLGHQRFTDATRGKRERWADSFPGAPVRKPNTLVRQTLILSQLWSQDLKSGCWQGRAPLKALGRGSLLLLQLLGSQQSLACGHIPPSRCFPIKSQSQVLGIMTSTYFGGHNSTHDNRQGPACAQGLEVGTGEQSAVLATPSRMMTTSPVEHVKCFESKPTHAVGVNNHISDLVLNKELIIFILRGKSCTNILDILG